MIYLWYPLTSSIAYITLGMMDKSSHPPHIFIGKISIFSKEYDLEAIVYSSFKLFVIEAWYIQNSYRHVPFDYNKANLSKHAIILTHLTNVSFDRIVKNSLVNMTNQKVQVSIFFHTSSQIVPIHQSKWTI